MKLQPSSATYVSLPVILGAIRAAIRPGATEALTSTLRAHLGMSDAVALSSLMRNTCAAVMAVKRRSPDRAKILLPRYACPSFIHGIRAAGMLYAYCDTDPETLSIAVEHLTAQDDPQIAALLVPNLFGYSADMPAIAELCRQRRWLLLEGADYTLGGELDGRPLGSFGDYSVLNFQEGKALPIGGGMALSRQADEFTNFRNGPRSSSLKAIARSLAYSLLIRPLAYGAFTAIINTLRIPKKQFSMEDTIRTTRSEFDFSVGEARLFERITPFQSTLGCRLWTQLPHNLAQRRHNAETLMDALSDAPLIQIIKKHPKLNLPHYIRLPILVSGGKRDGLCRHLIQAGFEASPMYVEHGMHVDAVKYPGAAKLCQELLTLPCHPYMRETDVMRLATATHKYLSS